MYRSHCTVDGPSAAGGWSWPTGDVCAVSSPPVADGLPEPGSISPAGGGGCIGGLKYGWNG